MQAIRIDPLPALMFLGVPHPAQRDQPQGDQRQVQTGYPNSIVAHNCHNVLIELIFLKDFLNSLNYLIDYLQCKDSTSLA